MSLMTLEPQVTPPPPPSKVTAVELRQLFLDSDICLGENELPADPEADLRLPHGGPVEELDLSDYVAVLERRYQVSISVPAWTMAENAGKPVPGGHKAYFSFATFADEINRQKSGKARPIYQLPTFSLRTPVKKGKKKKR